MRFTDAAGIVPHLAREEAERRHQYYLGPEHLLLGLLLGLLVGDENPMVRGLREHGLDLKVGDDNPAARVLRAHGLDLETVRARIDRLVAEGVLPGREAYDYAAQNVRLRPDQPFPRAPGAWTPLVYWLLALLRDAEDPVEVTANRYGMDRRRRAMFGLPDRGPSPVRLLVESNGLTLDQLRAAVLEELDRSEG
jgi:hypothetical protein